MHWYRFVMVLLNQTEYGLIFILICNHERKGKTNLHRASQLSNALIRWITKQLKLYPSSRMSSKLWCHCVVVSNITSGIKVSVFQFYIFFSKMFGHGTKLKLKSIFSILCIIFSYLSIKSICQVVEALVVWRGLESGNHWGGCKECGSYCRSIKLHTPSPHPPLSHLICLLFRHQAGVDATGHICAWTTPKIQDKSIILVGSTKVLGTEQSTWVKF